MKPSVLKSILLGGLILVTTACSDEAPDECLRSKNPQECNQWRDAGGDVSDYLIGGIAGFALAKVMDGGRQQTIIVHDAHYQGPPRHLRNRILSQDMQIAQMRNKIASQKLELQRQQLANAKKKAEISSLKSTTSYAPTKMNYSSRTSYSVSRPSSSSRRK
jgi:hypothetical protein